jgi:hypothetical protein
MADPVTEDFQRTSSRNTRIKLPQRTGGGIAWIGEGGYAFLLTMSIQALEMALVI